MVDERDLIPFETPLPLEEAFGDWRETFPQWDELVQCSVCRDPDRPLLPRDRFWVIKHAHAGQPRGHLVTYCYRHLTERGGEWTEGDRLRHGDVCPKCGLATPAGTGICDEHGPVSS